MSVVKSYLLHVICQMSLVICRLANVTCKMLYVKCHLSSCQISNVTFQMLSLTYYLLPVVKCQVSRDKCHLSPVRCHLSPLSHGCTTSQTFRCVHNNSPSNRILSFHKTKITKLTTYYHQNTRNVQPTFLNIVDKFGNFSKKSWSIF